MAGIFRGLINLKLNKRVLSVPVTDWSIVEVQGCLTGKAYIAITTMSTVFTVRGDIA